LVEALMSVACSQQSEHLALLLALGFNCVLRTSKIAPYTHQHLVVHDNNLSMSVIIPRSNTSQGNPPVLLVQDLPLVHIAIQVLVPKSKALL